MGRLFDFFTQAELGPDKEKRLKEGEELVHQRDKMANEAFAGKLEPITTKWPEEEISPEQKAKILMAAERLFQEYLERINLGQMTVEGAIKDANRNPEIEQPVKNETIKKLMLLADQERLVS